MSKILKITLVLIALVVTGLAGFRGFLWYYDQKNSYVTLEYIENDVQFIEFKPNLFELREAKESLSISRDKAVLLLLKNILKGSTVSYTNCKIFKVYGDINNYLITQVQCKRES